MQEDNGLTLAQVFPVCVTLPLRAVEVKLEVIPVAVCVPELLVMVIDFAVPFTNNSIGLPAVMEMGTKAGELIAMFASAVDVLLPLIFTLVAVTGLLPGVNTSVQELRGAILRQLLASCVIYPDNPALAKSAETFKALNTFDWLVTVKVPFAPDAVKIKGEPLTLIGADEGACTVMDNKAEVVLLP